MAFMEIPLINTVNVLAAIKNLTGTALDDVRFVGKETKAL